MNAEERARRRASWPSVKTDLQSADQELQPGPSDATAAWAAVLELTAECYAVASSNLTRIPRALWPSRLFKPGEIRPDSNGLT
jgi:hypothetical protein